MSFLLVSKHLDEARECISNGTFTTAVECCTSALKLDTANADAYVMRAAIYLQLGELGAAAEDASRALAHGGEDFSCLECFRIRAAARYQLGQWAAAIADCNLILETDSDDADVLSMRGFAKGQILDTKGALVDCLKAVALNPRDSGAWRVCGGAHLEFGKFQEAIKDFSECIRIDPRDTRAKLLLEMAQSKLSPQSTQKSPGAASKGVNSFASLASLEIGLGGLDFMDDIERDTDDEDIADHETTAKPTTRSKL